MDKSLELYAWPLLQMAGYILAAVIAIKLLQRVLFPPNAEKEEAPSEPDPAWVEGEPVTIESLRPEETLIREDGLPFVYLRKAEMNEYREGVEEWLFHPPGQKKDLWIGLTRDEVLELRRPKAETKGK